MRAADLNVPVAGAVLGGKYRIVAKLGEGGMGVVYRAQNILTGRHVALKWLHPHRGASQDGPLRLLREAQATARFRHPNVVDVYDVIQDGSTLFVVMELLEGETFRAYLTRQRNHPIPALLDMSRASCSRSGAWARRFQAWSRGTTPRSRSWSPEA